jgi:hypothetical protein
MVLAAKFVVRLRVNKCSGPGASNSTLTVQCSATCIISVVTANSTVKVEILSDKLTNHKMSLIFGKQFPICLFYETGI